MTDILLYAASLPALVVYFVAGAIAGGIGGLIGYVAGKQFGYEKIWQFTPVVFVVISFNLVTTWLDRASGPMKAVNELKQSRLFSLILKHHPEAERETFSRFEQIYSGPREQVSASSRILGAGIANRYVDLHTPTASNAAIHHVLQSQANIMRSLKGNPTVCVAQYLGTPAAGLESISQSLSAELLNAKADIIESSVTTPSPPPKNASIDEIVRAITGAYQAKGYDTAEIAKIANVQSLPPAEGCQIGYRFISALASMNETQGAFVYKGLIGASKQH